jgi:hypothetical protein
LFGYTPQSIDKSLSIKCKGNFEFLFFSSKVSRQVYNAFQENFGETPVPRKVPMSPGLDPYEKNLSVRRAISVYMIIANEDDLIQIQVK